ncbi:myb family transcription factor APL isoform X2 [Tripterygium wilfordii]|uniref:Myb family transcription factor APL isoform X2 n=1 Tax=Tripterygium wilfordii TaxID=458696 RepID=A0A7J7C2Z2_TRIWF|nr:myb family transcription factor APL isoform X2 [Tripterygium wilfordii]
MFHTKKPSTMNSHHENTRPMCVQGDSGLVLTTDPKPRLRWTVELHERFIDAVTQLGGPDTSALDLQRSCASSSGMMARSMNEYDANGGAEKTA